jgi:hypothetical protein
LRPGKNPLSELEEIKVALQNTQPSYDLFALAAFASTTFLKTF